MNYNSYQGYDDFYKAVYPDYDKDRTRKVVSRLFLALCVYTLISYAVVFLSEFFVLLVFGREKMMTILESPYYIFSVQIISMYLIALPVFMLICRTGITKISEEQKLKREAQKRNSSMSFEEMVVLFFISTAVMIIGGLISNMFTGLLSNILGHRIENSTAELISKTPIWLVIAVAVIIGPIVEEFIFRKTMIDILGEFGRGYAITVSAVAFGLFHGNFSQALYATLLGFILGFIYLKSGKLLHCAAMHIALNFFGTVPTLLLGGSIDRISEGTLTPEGGLALDYLNDLKNVIGLALLQYGCAIAGIALFCHFVFAKKYKVSFAKELTIPRYEVAHVTFANPGVITFIIFTIIQFVISIL